MKQQFSSERLSKQKSLMKYIREQLTLSDYRKLIYDISAIGRDSLDEIDVKRRDLSEELKRENPSYFQRDNASSATHAERFHGLESQKLRGLMTQLRGVAEKLATTALHHFGEEERERGERRRDEVIGSLEIKLSDSQVDDETCHGVIGLLSGALQGVSTEGTEEGQDEGGDDEEGGGNRTLPMSRGDKILAQELGISNSEAKFSAASMLAKSFLKIQSSYLDRLLLMNLKNNSLTDISCKLLCTVVEKSPSLRMLDIRGNMISSNGTVLHPSSLPLLLSLSPLSLSLLLSLSLSGLDLMWRQERRCCLMPLVGTPLCCTSLRDRTVSWWRVTERSWAPLRGTNESPSPHVSYRSPE
jgi:hypothetical protein